MIENHTTGLDALFACMRACRECAAACLAEPHVHAMSRCIQLDLACAAVCSAAAEAMLQQVNQANSLCQVCADICNACAEECERHEHDHCKKCAAACRHCASVCLEMVAA
ncbi:MAG: four-helix bundle copper-binding protein [Chitinophagaceae bacterium]|nr:four-helix bundle copper-binding protein [Chitinophagaceae bacterium]